MGGPGELFVAALLLGPWASGRLEGREVRRWAGCEVSSGLSLPFSCLYFPVGQGRSRCPHVSNRNGVSGVGVGCRSKTGGSYQPRAKLVEPLSTSPHRPENLRRHPRAGCRPGRAQKALCTNLPPAACYLRSNPRCSPAARARPTPCAPPPPSARRPPRHAGRGPRCPWRRWRRRPARTRPARSAAGRPCTQGRGGK